eukprot:1259697-Karenia_brevis.AAC.1
MAAVPVEIKVIDLVRDTTKLYAIKPHTPLEKLISAHCDFFGHDTSSVLFMHMHSQTFIKERDTLHLLALGENIVFHVTERICVDVEYEIAKEAAKR